MHGSKPKELIMKSMKTHVVHKEDEFNKYYKHYHDFWRLILAYVWLLELKKSSSYHDHRITIIDITSKWSEQNLDMLSI